MFNPEDVSQLQTIIIKMIIVVSARTCRRLSSVMTLVNSYKSFSDYARL